MYPAVWSGLTWLLWWQGRMWNAVDNTNNNNNNNNNNINVHAETQSTQHSTTQFYNHFFSTESWSTLFYSDLIQIEY